MRHFTPSNLGSSNKKIAVEIIDIILFLDRYKRRKKNCSSIYGIVYDLSGFHREMQEDLNFSLIF